MKSPIKGNMLPPNTEYLELNFVGETATGRGNNQQYIMENLHDGTFRGTESRVGITIGRHRPRSFINPIEKWNETYQFKVSRGYIVTKTKKMEKKVIEKNTSSINGSEYAPITDSSVNQVVQLLLECTTAVLNQNYRIKIDDISDEMIEYGQNILRELDADYSKMSVAEFNNKLKVLYAAVPRRIDNLSKKLAKRKLDFNDIIADEQELFDVMVNRVRNNKELSSCSVRPTVLEAFHLDWRDVTNDERSYILEKLEGSASQYIKAWRVTNRRTEERFRTFCKKEDLSEQKGIDHLFHGSRTENFWSIVTNGLLINPDSGVIRTGSMFGNGTYFAPLAKKSLGYTSGGYWTGGDGTKFLAIYKVATGKRYDIYSGSDTSLNKRVLQMKCPGAHCTWAHGGSTGGTTLYNDEVIVYDEAQSTIEYLIMMK